MRDEGHTHFIAEQSSISGPATGRSAETREAMAKQGNDIKVSTPEAADRFFRDETGRYARLIKKIGLKID